MCGNLRLIVPPFQQGGFMTSGVMYGSISNAFFKVAHTET